MHIYLNEMQTHPTNSITKFYIKCELMCLKDKLLCIDASRRGVLMSHLSLTPFILKQENTSTNQKRECTRTTKKTQTAEVDCLLGEKVSASVFASQQLHI